MTKTIDKNTPRRVLVFNPLKKLIIICQSVTAAAGAFKVSPTNIHYACTGKNISCCGLYFRHLQDDIEIDEGDLGNLDLVEYDKLCGVERSYYKTQELIKKYSKNKKQEDENPIAIRRGASAQESRRGCGWL